MPRLAESLAGAGRSALKLDRSKVAADVGARVAIGLAVTLLIGRLSGHTVAGVTATIGALSAGMASHQGTYRSRAAVTFVAGAAMGAASFVGATVGHVVGPDIVATAAIAFAAAMLVALGAAGMVVGIQMVVGVCVFSQFAFPVAVAARDGGLVAVGGAVQTLLVGGLWPLRRFPAERRTVAAAYQELASFCRRTQTEPAYLIDPAAFDGLDEAARDPQPFGGDEAGVHQALAAQVDRLRLDVSGLARLRHRLADGGEDAAVASVDGMLSVSAGVMHDVATAVREGRSPSALGEARDVFEVALRRLDHRRSDPHLDARTRATTAAAYDRAQALAGQLRAVGRLAAVAAGADPASVESEILLGRGRRPPPAKRGGQARAWLDESLGTFRANLTRSSQVFRHAIRLSVTVAVAVGVSYSIPVQHRYWLPMTAMLVLRPDFASTVTRGLSRVVGTLVGAGLVTFVLAEAKPGPDWLIGIVLVLGFLATSVVLANYAVFSALIAALVVTLLAFTGDPGASAAWDRSFYTVIGAALALAAYMLWPTWEATTLAESLADLARVEGVYAHRVLVAWSDPEAADRSGLEQVRHQARLGRSNTEAVLGRWRGEPARPDRSVLPAAVVTGYMGAIRSCVQSIVALHASLPEAGRPHPEAAVLGRMVDKAMGQIADMVVVPTRAGESLPPLRQQQLRLVAGLGIDDIGTEADPLRFRGHLILAGETDVVVDAVDTLGHLVGLSPP